MIYHARHFKIHELVCRHAFEAFDEARLWSFFDERLLITADFLADHWGTVYANNWFWGGDKTQRGLRCNLCQLVKDETTAGRIYCSAHNRGAAADLIFRDITSDKLRLWIAANQSILIFPVRLEKGTPWLHIDVSNTGTNKVEFFNKRK